MDRSWWLGDRPRRGRVRAAIALVERMERRDLLAVTVQSISATAGKPFAGLVAQFTTENLSGPAAGYHATISWGDQAGDTSFGTIVPAAGQAGVYDVMGGPFTYGRPGPATVSVTVTGGNNTSDTNSRVVTVKDATLTVVALNFSAKPGVSTSANVAQFTSANPNAKAGDFAATIYWGDGTPTTGGVVVANPRGGFFVSGAHTYAAAGAYTTTVTVQDTQGVTPFSSTATASVASSPPAFSAIGQVVVVPAGQPIPPATVIGSFTDSVTGSQPSDFVAVINWGDGNVSQGTVSADPKSTPAQPLYDVTGTNTYAVVGKYNPTIAVQDRSGHSTTITSTVQVTGPQIAAAGTAFSATAGVPFADVVAMFTDTNAADNASNLSALINWGNSTTSLGTIVAVPNSPGRFEVLGGGYTYPATGTFKVTVTITDPSGQQGVANSTAVVTNVPPGPTFAGALVTSPGVGLPGNTVDTNTDRPTFGGTAAPFSVIQLFARRDGVDATMPLGQTVAGPAGQWSLTVGPLLDGYYAVTATVTPPGGYPAAGLPLANNGLVVVDTVAPVVDSVTLQRNSAQVVVTFSDGLSGINLASALNRANYAFVGPRGVMITPVSVALRSQGILPTDPVSVVLTATLNPRLRGRLTTLRIINSGITDQAGNQLAGSFQGVYAPLGGTGHRAARSRR